MSKYSMNKLIHLVNMNQDAEKEYKANPREFVEKWEKTQTLKLEPEERDAAERRPRVGGRRGRFGLFGSREEAQAAAAWLQGRHPWRFVPVTTRTTMPIPSIRRG